jgi:nucleoside-diphosphate-sugar epimerase
MKIYVAGHRGMAGSALVRRLRVGATSRSWCARAPSWIYSTRARFPFPRS